MSDDNFEHELEQLGSNWPGESVVDRVTSSLPQTATPPMQHSPTAETRSAASIIFPALGVVVTTVAIVAFLMLGFGLNAPQTLQAALQQSLRQANTWHVTTQQFDGENVVKSEVWFHRDHGFRMNSAVQVIVDNGEDNYTWFPTDKDSSVLLRPSQDGVAMIANMFDLSRIPAEWKKQRKPDLDQEISGTPCEAYSYLIVGGAKLSDGDERMLVFVDRAMRLRKAIRQSQVEKRWSTDAQISMDYEQPIPESVFRPDFPANAKVVDVRTILDGLYPLAQAVASEEKDGLIFAVHDLVPVDDGSWYIVSSVRGTPEYLRKYPPKPRRVNLNHSVIDVASQSGSHASSGSGYQCLMYQTEWQGVDYLWRMYVPGYRGGVKNRPKPGMIRVPLHADHMHRNRRDARGVQLTTRLELDLPIPEKTSTLSEIVAIARKDITLAGSVFAEPGSVRIATSIRNDTVQFVSLNDLTDEEYVRELLKTRWQMENGEWTGIDPPEDWKPTVVDLSEPEEAWVEPPPKYGDDPMELPAEIDGLIVDVNGTPIPDAQVTVYVRRFSNVSDTESDGPGPWKAVTDSNGRYTINPSGTIRPNNDQVRISVLAENFADTSAEDYEKSLLEGSLPDVKMFVGRRIEGRLVDDDGNAVNKAILRFQSNDRQMTETWDSGPFPVADDGRFSLSIPQSGMAVAAVYPEDFAPRFVDVAQAADQGNIQLSKGVALKGQVLDADGKGVAKTVVGIRNEEHRLMFAYGAVIGMAVRTEDDGFFQLPPLDGRYKLTVGNSLPDFSRRMMLLGEQPPLIEPVVIDVNAADPENLIELRAETREKPTTAKN